jgi:cell division protein FtsW
MTQRSRSIDSDRSKSLVAKRREEVRQYARQLCGVTMFLIVLGALALFSATSSPLASEGHFPYSSILKHLGFLCAGLLLAAGVAAALPRISGLTIKVIVNIAFLVNLALLAAVRFTPLGPEIFGARRWIDLGGMRFQPSEFLKITLVLLIATVLLEGGKRAFGSFRTDRGKMLTFRRDRLSLAWAYFAVFASVGLVVIQPDLGTSSIVLATSLAAMLLAGVSPKSIVKFFLFLIICGIIGYLIMPQKYQYAIERVKTHFNPTKDVSDEGYQITQSMVAISQAGMFGRGYMHSLQKMNRLPLQDRDFIFAVWVEETGLIGGLLVVMLFLYFAFLCLRISLLLPYGFESVAVFGLGFNLALQAIINVSTNVGALPVSGMTLPFFSSGGTSIVVSLFIVGLILGLVQRKLGGAGGKA